MKVVHLKTPVFWSAPAPRAAWSLSQPDGRYSQQTRCETYVGLMLCQRRRRWHNIKPTLVQGVVFVELVLLRKANRSN